MTRESELADPLSIPQIDKALADIRRQARELVASVGCAPGGVPTALQAALVEQVQEICLAYLKNLCEQRLCAQRIDEVRCRNELLERQLELLLSLVADFTPGTGPEGGAAAPDVAQVRALGEKLRQLLARCCEKSGGAVDESGAAVPSLAASVPGGPAPPAQHPPRRAPIQPGQVVLEVHMLGGFQVFDNGVPIERWPKGKGRQILKYLLLNRHVPVPKEVLMEVFWPDQEATNARNNLNVAVYSIRRAFRKVRRGFFHIVFQNGAYLLNPEVEVWIDTEAFLSAVREGRQREASGQIEAAMAAYRKAVELYRGDFLPEDIYEDWTAELREEYRNHQRELLDRLGSHYLQAGDVDSCLRVSRRLVAMEPCEEAAHERLMRCYVALGQRHLALRQFTLCEKALRRELDLAPGPDIRKLYEEIRSAAGDRALQGVG